MKAIVLTFDPHLEIANLVVESYNRLWPQCPFQFRIPFSDRDPGTIFRAPNVEFVRTPRDIRNTMENLLRGLPDNEFVFWCVDDRYPIEIFDSAAILAVNDFVSSEAREIDSVKLTDLSVEGVQGKSESGVGRWFKNVRRPDSSSRTNEPTWRQREESTEREPAFNLAGRNFFRQLGQPKNGFYMPQFTTPAFLKRFFFSPNLPGDYGIREFHDFLCSTEFEHRSYFPKKFLLAVGESTFGGKLSAACYQRMLELGIAPPKIDIVNDYKIYSDRDWAGD